MSKKSQRAIRHMQLRILDNPLGPCSGGILITLSATVTA